MSLSPSAPRTNPSAGNGVWRRRLADEVLAALMQTLAAFDPDNNATLAGIRTVGPKGVRLGAPSGDELCAAELSGVWPTDGDPPSA